ncbi:MAG: hypothetical protein ACMUHX_05045 [bacterium]
MTRGRLPGLCQAMPACGSQDSLRIGAGILATSGRCSRRVAWHLHRQCQ